MVMNIDSIRRILLQDWDPMGVGDNPNLTDEYDAFIPTIYKMLNSNCTYDQLTAYLKSIEENDVETAVSAAARHIAVEKLLGE